jgi:hypothetical protein
MTEGPKSDIPVGTPEGYTKEEPSVEEIGQPGTPGEAVAADAAHATDLDDPVAHHADTHMDSHTVLSDDDHGHAEAALGPIDWTAWGYTIVGGVAGLIVLYFFWLAVA